jgi:hypothetical protein
LLTEQGILDNEHIEVVYEMGEVVGFTGEGSDESEWDGTINKSTVWCAARPWALVLQHLSSRRS